MATATTTRLSLQADLADRGSPRKDHELVNFVGRHGVVCIEHVMATLGVRRAQAYRRVATLIEAGLLERLDLLSAEPSLLRATRDGLRFAGLGLPLAMVSPGEVDHYLRCASTALLLAERYGEERILTERELAFLERVEEHPIASARLGELPSGAPRLHCPDLAILTEDRPIAIEVELTPKAPHRLKEIVRAWRRAGWVAEVHYHCAPGVTRRAVERAIAKTHASERVFVCEALPR
jgi:hypothetical protein